MSSNKSHHVISFEKLIREEKSSEYFHPFGGRRNAQCPLCKAVFTDCRAMYLHVAKQHQRSAASPLLPGRTFSIPEYKRQPIAIDHEVVCIICRTGMHEDMYTNHVLRSHPWILDQSTRTAWVAPHGKGKAAHGEEIHAHIPESLHHNQDQDFTSIGDILKAKHPGLVQDEGRIDPPKRNRSVEIAPQVQVQAQHTPNRFPALPTALTVLKLITYLANQGVKVDNNRATRGGLCVYLGKKRFKDLAKFLQDNGVGVIFNPERRGKRIRDRFLLDPGERLQ